METLRAVGRRAGFWFFYVLAWLFVIQWLNNRSERPIWGFWIAASAGAALFVVYSERRSRRAGEQAAHAQRQVDVLRLAETEGGRLTVTGTAARLGWTLRTAVQTLRTMEDGLRVTTLPTADGVRMYVFPELIHASPTAPDSDSPALKRG